MDKKTVDELIDEILGNAPPEFFTDCAIAYLEHLAIAHPIEFKELCEEYTS